MELINVEEEMERYKKEPSQRKNIVRRMGQKWEAFQYQRLVEKHKSRDRGGQVTRRENEGGQAWRMSMVGRERESSSDKTQGRKV